MDRVQLSTIGTVCGAIVLFICIFYDKYKRRDLNFKRKMLKRREELQRMTTIDLKEMYDPRERQSYILHEIELAENLMSQNNITDAINHFVNAIIICEEPFNIIKALGQTLPPSAYKKLIEQLENIQSEKFSKLNEKLEMNKNLLRLF